MRNYVVRNDKRYKVLRNGKDVRNLKGCGVVASGSSLFNRPLAKVMI